MANIIDEQNKQNALTVTPTSQVNQKQTMGLVPTNSQSVNNTNTGAVIPNPNGQNQYTNGVQPAQSYTDYLFRPAGSLAGLKQDELSKFYAQEQQNLQGRSIPVDLFSSAVGGVNEFALKYNPITLGEKIVNLFPTSKPTTKALNAMQQTQQNFQSPVNFLDQERFNYAQPNLNQSQQDYLSQLNALNRGAYKIQPTNINLGQPQFNPQNIQNAYNQARQAEGTQVDLGAYNEMLKGLQSQAQTKLSQSDLDKMSKTEQAEALRKDASSQIQDAWTNQSFGRAIMNLAQAGGKNKQATEIEKNLARMSEQDRVVAQQELSKLGITGLSAEENKQLKNTGFAQQLAAANMSNLNAQEMAKQGYDQRMKELGIDIQQKDVTAQRLADMEARNYQQQIDKMKILSPEQQQAFRNQDLWNSVLNAQQVNLNPNATEQQKQQANYQSMVAKQMLNTLTPQKSQLKTVESGGVLYSFDEATGTVKPLAQSPKAQQEKLDLISSYKSMIDNAKTVEEKNKLANELLALQSK